MLLAVALLVGGALWAKRNFDKILSHYKGAIEIALSDVLSLPVSITSIRGHLGRQFRLKLDGLKIGGSEECISVKEVSLSSPLASLLRRELVVTAVSVKEPTVVIVEGESGSRVCPNSQRIVRDSTQAEQASLPQFDFQKIQLESLHFIIEKGEGSRRQEIVINHGLLSLLTQAPNLSEQQFVNVEVLLEGGALVGGPSFGKVALENLTIGLDKNGTSSVVGHLAIDDLKSNKPGLIVKTLSTDVNLSGKNLVLNRPNIEASLSGQRVAAFCDGVEMDTALRTLKITGGVLSLADQKVALSGAWAGDFIPEQANLESGKLDLAKVGQLLDRLLPGKAPAVGTGTASFAIIVQKKGKAWLGSGKLAVNAYENKEADIAVGQVSLPNLTVIFRSVRDFQANFALAISDLAIRDRNDRYSTGNASGTVSLQGGTKEFLGINADLKVNKFGFQNEDIAITDVSGDVKNAKVGISQKFDVLTRLDFTGGPVTLRHPSISVDGADEVSAPISINIPSAGGYRVEGPVKIRNARLNTMGRDFEKVSATVQMFISGPLKQFTSERLDFVNQNRAGWIKTDFAMTPEWYDLREFQTGFFGGTTLARAKMGRHENTDIISSLEVTNANVAQLAGLVSPETKGVSGLIKSLTAEAQGNKRDILPSLKGKGEVAFQEEIFREVGLTTRIASALRSVPAIGPVISPEKLADDRKQVSFSSKFSAENQKVSFDDVRISRPKYNVEGSGNVGFDGIIDFKGNVIFLSDSARALGLGITPLASILGRVGKIEVPIFIRGHFKDPSVTPDIAGFVSHYSGLGLATSTVGGIWRGGKNLVEGLTGAENGDSSSSLAASD